MQREKSNFRVLAIDLRRSRFGYAVYEGPKRLLDWGGRSCSTIKGGSTLAASRVAELLKLFHPSAVVLRKDRRGGVRGGTPEIRQAAKAIRQQATARSVPVFVIGPEEIKTAFNIFRTSTKDDVAVILTSIFPELLGELPRKRKRWDNEHPRMAVFDAIAVGFAYFRRNGAHIPSID
jgi:hypothetical protein